MPVGILLFLFAWAPALAAVGLGISAGVEWERILHAVFSALVYAPVALIVLSIRRRAVAVIAAGLAVSSGLVSLYTMLDAAGLRPPAVLGELAATAILLAEVSAIGLLIWALRPLPGRRLGVALGLAALLLAAGLRLAAWTGADLAGWAIALPLLLALPSFLLGAAALIGLRSERPDIPPVMLVWFAVGSGLLLVSYLRLVPGADPAMTSLTTAAALLAHSLLPTAVLASVFGGARAVIDRRLLTGIVWVQALAAGIGLYVLAGVIMSALGVGRAVAGAAAAALLALSFTVMLSVVRRATELAFFGPGADPRQVLGQLAVRVSEEAGADGRDELLGIAVALREIWSLRSVDIRSGSDGRSLAAVGEAGPASTRHELISGERVVGTIRCTSDDDAMLTNIVEPLLEQIGGMLGAIVQIAIANQDLASLRERTQEVNREERRLLHRELHDELAPSLTGIGFAITGARHLVAAGSDEAAAAVVDVQAETVAAADRVRRLARALLPTALDAGDLDGALRELAVRFSHPGFSVTAQAPGTDEMESGAQLTVYLVLADAVEILSRVGSAREVSIDLELGGVEASAALVIEPEHDEDVHRALEKIARRCAEAGGRLNGCGPLGHCTVPTVVIPL